MKIAETVITPTDGYLVVESWPHVIGAEHLMSWRVRVTFRDPAAWRPLCALPHEQRPARVALDRDELARRGTEWTGPAEGEAWLTSLKNNGATFTAELSGTGRLIYLP